MLTNLKAEMLRKDVKAKDLADAIGTKRLSTIYDKLNGHYSFTFDEAFEIQSRFFPEHELIYLFKREEVHEHANSKTAN